MWYVYLTLLVVLVMDGCAARHRWALPVLGLAFIAFGMFGRGLPAPFGHKGLFLGHPVQSLFCQHRGIYGTSVSVGRQLYLFVYPVRRGD
jgi:TRAP-type uncharacterized transport system fused permease subunit